MLFRSAQKLATQFSKELRIEDNDLRPFLSEADRLEWDRRENALKLVEARKLKPLPAALAFADFGAKPRETFLLARGDFHAKGEAVELGFLSALTGVDRIPLNSVEPWRNG